MTRTRTSGLALAVAWIATTAAADPLAITTTGELPFTRGELEAALAARAGLATAQTPRRLDARISGDASHVQIEVAGRARTVALDGEHGADAARLVAFSILDVAGDQLDPPAGSAEPALAHDAPIEPPVAAVARDAADSWSLALWAIAGTHEVGALEVGVPIAHRVRVVGSAGAALATTATAMARSVDVRAFPVRAELAARVGPIELRAGAIAIAERASAARSSLDALAGAGVGAVYVLPVTHGFALLAGGGGDAFANALDYRVDGVHVMTTDRFAWWVGAALAREARW